MARVVKVRPARPPLGTRLFAWLWRAQYRNERANLARELARAHNAVVRAEGILYRSSFRETLDDFETRLVAEIARSADALLHQDSELIRQATEEIRTDVDLLRRARADHRDGARPN